MSDNYDKIVQDNIRRLYGNLPIDLSENLPGEEVGEQFHFDAFGEKCVLSPLKSFKEFPDSISHVAASAMPTNKLLGPHVTEIRKAKQSIVRTFNGEKGPSEAGGDFSFTLYPLPKIALCYIFYEADDDFSASVRCLYSNNANQFMPASGLADVGEYTSKQILKLIDH